MKDLAEDYKAIWKKDRGLLWWMAANFLLNLWLFLMAIFGLDSSRPKVWVRYSDISNGYQQSEWWYLGSFALIAFIYEARQRYSEIIFGREHCYYDSCTALFGEYSWRRVDVEGC